MEKATHVKIGALAVAFLLIGTFTVAQSAHKDRTLRPREGSSGQASGATRTLKPSERRAPDNLQRKNGAIAHSDYSRPADQRKASNMGGVDGGSDAAAHAAARSKAPSDAPAKASANTRTGENPLYQDRGNSGENPLYESKDQLKASAGSSNSQPDPKSAAVKSKKHVAGVKYQDRSADGQPSNNSSNSENFKQDFGQVQASKH